MRSPRFPGSLFHVNLSEPVRSSERPWGASFVMLSGFMRPQSPEVFWRERIELHNDDHEHQRRLMQCA
jgi:hypothetical protein